MRIFKFPNMRRTKYENVKVALTWLKMIQAVDIKNISGHLFLQNDQNFGVVETLLKKLFTASPPRLLQRDEKVVTLFKMKMKLNKILLQKDFWRTQFLKG